MTPSPPHRSLTTRLRVALKTALGNLRELVLSRRVVFQARRGLMELRKRRRSTLREGNICMLHLGRCGSTVVGSLLGQHPAIHWDGEVFDRVRRRKLPEMWMVKEPLRMLELRMQWAACRYYGFETKFGRDQHLGAKLLDLPLPTYVERLQELGFSYFVLLERRNYLRQIASRLIAWKRGRQHLPAHRHAAATRIHLPVEEISLGGAPVALAELFADLDRRYEEARQLVSNLGGLHLVYEDDVEQDPKRAYGKICDYLNVERLAPRVPLSRTNPYPLSRVLENAGEVEAHLNGTPYRWMLSE